MDVFNSILGWLGDQINALLSFLCVVLPDSPFKLLDYTPISPYIPYINYFVPLDFMVDALAFWLVAILCYYGFSILMRWVKAIQ